MDEFYRPMWPKPGMLGIGRRQHLLCEIIVQQDSFQCWHWSGSLVAHASVRSKNSIFLRLVDWKLNTDCTLCFYVSLYLCLSICLFPSFSPSPSWSLSLPPPSIFEVLWICFATGCPSLTTTWSTDHRLSGSDLCKAKWDCLWWQSSLTLPIKEVGLKPWHLTNCLWTDRFI